MNPATQLHLQDWFDKYVQSFYSEDVDVQAHIRLKEDHTARVCNLMRELAASMNLAPEQALTAEVVALLHDIGRFSQYQKYRTFNDFRSENHACLGVRILRQEKVLDGIPAGERDLILKAVRYHNDRTVPPDDDDEAVFFAKMIRDVDKIDILEMVTSDEDGFKMLPSPEFGGVLTWSDDMALAILDGQVGRYEQVRSAGDQMLFRMSWLYDMNFPWTYRKVRERRFLEKMASTFPDATIIRKVASCLISVRDQRADP